MGLFQSLYSEERKQISDQNSDREVSAMRVDFPDELDLLSGHWECMV